MADTFIYDTVPYPSYVFPQTHPDRLATMAAFHGMQAADPGNCRVLELGCGDGTNLISFAYALPDSAFIGLDLSETHIAGAKSTAGELGVQNITFFEENVMDFDRERHGEFDFIIAHGLYSWVPAEVRERVLRIYSECLAANGIGYISYNAYPGCHIREIMEGAMRFHTAGIVDPFEKVRQGVAVLGFLGDAAEAGSLYQSMIRLEAAEIADRTIENVFHDDLSEINQPFYFYEFIASIAPNGLQFVCEANPTSMQTHNLSPETQQALAALGTDVIRREQYLDFIKCRRFRSTLVCRDNVVLDRQPPPEILRKFFIAGQIRPESESPVADKQIKERFLGPKDASVEIDHPLTKAALIQLSKVGSLSIRFDDLIAEAQKMLPGGDYDLAAESQKTMAYLLQMFQVGLISLHLHRTEFVSVVSDRPAASAFARWQIRHNSESVTTLTGSNLRPENDLIRQMILLLDGTRDRNRLIEDMMESIEVPEDEREAFVRDLPGIIESNLTKMASAGLLIS